MDCRLHLHRWNTYSYTDTNSYTDTYSNTNSNTDSNTYTYSNAYTNTDPNWSIGIQRVQRRDC